jgi:hypothetical protein
MVATKVVTSTKSIGDIEEAEVDEEGADGGGAEDEGAVEGEGARGGDGIEGSRGNGGR